MRTIIKVAGFALAALTHYASAFPHFPKPTDPDDPREDPEEGFTLQVIHSSDNESNFQDVNTLEEKIIFYSAITNGLEKLAEEKKWASLHLAAGDHTIPSPFYRASSQVETFSTGDAGGKNGIGDILFYNTIGFNANGMGNHEFDGGIDDFAEMLAVAEYPFLAANLDFSNVVQSGSPDIKIVADAGPCEDAFGAVSKSCFYSLPVKKDHVVKVGLIGRAPADFFNIIEDPDNTIPGLDFVGGRDENNDPLVPATSQVLEQVEVLTSAGCQVIILLDHSQDFTNDPIQIQDLFGIDIIVTAGSTGFFAQSTNFKPFNKIRDGDEPDESYPVVSVDRDNNPVLVVESDELWNYIGHLVVHFDKHGVIKTWDGRSGPIATTQEAVDLLADILGVASLEEDPDVRTILDDLQATEIITDGFTEIGTTEFPLNGVRSDVRSRETNLGRLAAASSIWGAEQEGFSPVIALKNGGGIRAPIIGPSIIRLGIQTALAFDNRLSVVELSATQLLAAMENAYSRVPALDGRFAQLAGITVTFDPSKPGLEAQEEVDTPSRITQLTLLDGTEIVVDGVLLDPSATFVMATNSFLLTGGDGYVSLAGGNVLGETGIGEQKILEDYVTTVLGGNVAIEDPPTPPLVIEL